MARTRNDFLSDCDTDERTAFEQIFADIEALSEQLGDPNPPAEEDLKTPLADTPLRLRFAFEAGPGASLRLQHPKLKNQVPLLLCFPSKNLAEDQLRNTISVIAKNLTAVGIKQPDVEAYGKDLSDAELQPVGRTSWRTSTSGLSDGLTRIFRYPTHRTGLVVAIQKLVGKINLYPDLPPASAETPKPPRTRVSKPRVARPVAVAEAVS